MAQRPQRKLAIDIILDETIIYGGLLMTRREVKAEMESEGHDPRCIDYFVFHPDAVKLEQFTQISA